MIAMRGILQSWSLAGRSYMLVFSRWWSVVIYPYAFGILRCHIFSFTHRKNSKSTGDLHAPSIYVAQPFSHFTVIVPLAWIKFGTSYRILHRKEHCNLLTTAMIFRRPRCSSEDTIFPERSCKEAGTFPIETRHLRLC